MQISLLNYLSNQPFWKWNIYVPKYAFEKEGLKSLYASKRIFFETVEL